MGEGNAAPAVRADARVLLQAAQVRDADEALAGDIPPRQLDDYHSGAAALAAQVDRILTSIESSGERQIADRELTQRVVMGTLGSLSVGAVTWLLRAGFLLTGMFSPIPMWASSRIPGTVYLFRLGRCCEIGGHA